MKKAQIHFTETIFVLLILVIIIFIGVIFTFLYLNRPIQEKQETLTLIDAITITSSIINMPELTCGITENCIDSLKILSFNKVLTSNPDKQQYYSSLFQKKRISVQIIYPATIDPTTPEQCSIDQLGTIGNPVPYPETCNEFLIYGPATSPAFSQRLETPLLIHFPIINKKALGLLVIEVYQ